MESGPKPPDRNSNGGADSNRTDRLADNGIHPAWLALIRYCRELGHGELERLCIQDGVPVLAEHVRQKVKFKT
jgi:hypothetical protein